MLLDKFDLIIIIKKGRSFCKYPKQSANNTPLLKQRSICLALSLRGSAALLEQFNRGWQKCSIFDKQKNMAGQSEGGSEKEESTALC